MDEPTFTLTEVLQAGANVGVDVDCGACVLVFLTGATEHPHVCRQLAPEKKATGTLWHPPAAKRTRVIARDMRAGSRPNPYFLTAADIGCRVFGAPIKQEDVGSRCQLVFAHDGETSVFQMENRHQLAKRLEDK